MEIDVCQVTAEDYELIDAVLDCFSEVFQEPETYSKKRPDREYLTELLNSSTFIGLAGKYKNEVAGALVAYELQKFEQNRSEIYIYDLAVYEKYRKQGVATTLINALKPIAKSRGAWVIFVQADYEDQSAINLYTKMGVREEVLHFDIPIEKNT